jgi:single-strand DNA-binding protein
MNFKELVRVGKDAVLRSTPAGKQVMGFSAAFDNGWGDRKQTVWLDCSAWGDRWEKVSDYIVKGSQIVVEGNIGTREHNGTTYITLDVSDIKLISRNEQPPQPRQKAPESAWDESDSAPF